MGRPVRAGRSAALNQRHHHRGNLAHNAVLRQVDRQPSLQVRPDLGKLNVTPTTNQTVDAPNSSNHILRADSVAKVDMTSEPDALAFGRGSAGSERRRCHYVRRTHSTRQSHPSCGYGPPYTKSTSLPTTSSRYPGMSLMSEK